MSDNPTEDLVAAQREATEKARKEADEAAQAAIEHAARKAIKKQEVETDMSAEAEDGVRKALGE